MTRKTKQPLIGIAIIFLFVSLAAVATFLFLRYRFGEPKQGLQTVGEVGVAGRERQEDVWQVYVNEDYKFMLEHPQLLHKRETKDEGGYDFFVRFEENEFAKGKGIAVGVSELDLNEEKERLTTGFTGYSQDLKIDEEEILIGEHKGLKLSVVTGDADLENRVFVIVNNGAYTFSLSTTPEQIDKLLSSFSFL